MPIIIPEQLNVDAMVPQCLDNQYISNDVCKYMSEHHVDYNDPVVHQMRKEDTQTEFIRSLIYSSQVVVNRAYLKNNHLLYYNYLPQDPDLQQAFIQLLCDGRIIPFLLDELTLDQKLDLNTRVESDRALSELLLRAGDVTCVRFAEIGPGGNDDANKRDKGVMYSKFGQYFSGLNAILHQNDLYNNMLSEFNASLAGFDDRFGGELNPEVFEDIRDYLDHFSDYCHHNNILTREMVYRKYFIRGVKNKGSLTPQELDDAERRQVTDGIFKNFKKNKYLFLLKKLVDLRYNANLPDLLKRYTFTPMDMPSRMALQDIGTERSPDAGKVAQDALDHFAEINIPFLAENQRGMYLPLFRDLTVADVVEIQQFDEWHLFIDEQKRILSNPLSVLNRLPEYSNRLIALQQKISQWYMENDRIHKPREKARFWPYVTVLIIAGGLSLVLGAPHQTLADALAEIERMACAEIGNITISLLVNMIDVDKSRANRELSYSIQVIKDSNYITKEELRDIVIRALQVGGDTVEKNGKEPERSKQ